MYIRMYICMIVSSMACPYMQSANSLIFGGSEEGWVGADFLLTSFGLCSALWLRV